MTTITISDDKCWVCNSTKNLTIHHTLPKNIKPLHNVLIPVCENCHQNKINVEDVNGMLSFAYSLQKQQESLNMQIFKLNKLLERKTGVSFTVKEKKYEIEEK